MTRETKVGLVVAGSFIVLVGIVVASKMRGGGAPAGNEVAQTVTAGGEESETTEKKTAPTEESKGVAPPKPLPEGIRPVAATETVPKASELPSLPALPSLPPGLPSADLTLPPPVPTGEDDQKKMLEALRSAKETSLPPGLPLPGLPKSPELPPLPGPEKVALVKDTLPSLPPVPPPSGGLPTADTLPPLPTPPGPPKKDELAPPPPVFPGGTPKKDDLLPPLPPPAVVKDPPPAVFPMPGKVDVPPPVPLPTPKKDMTPSLPPIDPGPFGKKETAPPAGIAPPLPVVKDSKDPAPLPPPLGSDFKNPTAPVGVAPPVSTPSSTLPKVTTVDIPPYVLRPDDRDIDSVSKRVYGSERYAGALLAFNREHPLAKEEIRQTPPRLVSGQMLYIPPRELLEGKYASLILPEGRPVIGAPPGPDVAPVKIATSGPPPVGTAPPGVPAVGIKATPGTPVSLGTPGGATVPPTRTELTKSFVVNGAGLHIIQIAQQTLGDSRRWPEIYRLNPSIQPQNVIPTGTELKLPMDARVP